MLKRIAAALAVGATMFGLAGAGASMLDTNGSATAVQQTNALSATCQTTSVNFDNVVTNQAVSSTRFFQQSIEPGCSNEFVQVALKMDNGSIAYSNKVWIPTSNVTSASQLAFLIGGSTNPSEYGYAVYGEDLYPEFTGLDVCAADVVSTVVTIAGQINSPGSNTAPAVTGTLPTCANDSFFATGE
jgi:hypothetical protein